MQFGLNTVSWPPVVTKMGIMQQRRKWSDWSECSIECKKTRHRLDCEDLLVAQQQQNSSNSSLATKNNNNNKSQRTIAGQQNGYDELTKRQVNKLNDDQLEDEEDGEDYGDVGDDEGVTDSCDKVEPSKTYQEVACRGGSCNSAVNNRGPSSKRPTSFAVIEDGLGAPKAVATSTATIKSSLATIQDARSPVVDSFELQDKAKEPQVRSNYTTLIRGEQSVLPPATIWPPAPRPMQATTPSSTKNMWLPQFSGGFNQDSLAHVVQWAILIGALLTVILLIVLMLRKLFVATFPSYHWMLAKQTIKSGANAYTVADCFHPTTSSLSCPSAAGSVVLEPPHRHPHNSHHQRQHHLAPRHYCVDTKGRTHLVATLANQQPEDQIYVEPTEVVAAERSSAATTSSSGYRQLLAQLSRPSDFSEGNQSLRSTANYATGNYDTLNSCDKGIVLTRDFISYPAQDQEHATHHHQRHQHPSLVQQPHQTRSIKANVAGMLPPNRSLSSSLSNDEDAENKLNDAYDDQDERSSGQSTTAQMLSNAASSSFEQPPEFESPSIVTSQPTSTGATAKGSPASFTHRPRNQQSAKLTNQSNLAKSQPNSPMFANQFHNKHHQNRRHPTKLSAHKRSLSQEAEGRAYARPEERVAHLSSGVGGGASSSHSNSSDQNVLKLVRDLEVGHCDNSQDRHHYESLDEHRLNEDQE